LVRWRNCEGFEWQETLGAFSVSDSRRGEIAYIRNQEEHRKKRSFEEEFIAMLKADNVERSAIPFDNGSPMVSSLRDSELYMRWTPRIYVLGFHMSSLRDSDWRTWFDRVPDRGLVRIRAHPFATANGTDFLAARG
jgi:hypothetical protein